MNKSKLKILAGDDHLLSLRLLTRQLEQLGFPPPQTVSNGEEVQKLLEQEPFDIVILDWVMPVKNGMTVLAECRAQAKYAGVAFLMLSSEAHAHMVQQALDAGANAYAIKPVNRASLEEKMNVVLSWLAEERKNARQV